MADGVIRSGREQDVADNVLPSVRFDGVLHLAGSIETVESVKKSEKYWDNNVHPAKEVPLAARRHGVLRLIFSSPGAVHGGVAQRPIPETRLWVPRLLRRDQVLPST